MSYMAYVPKELTEQELFELISREAFQVIMNYFKENPNKTVMKVKFDGQKTRIRKFEYQDTTKYTIVLY